MAVKPKSTKSKAQAKTSAKTAGVAGAALVPPAGGAIVRMYRIGHGDCFLIAFAAKKSKRPAYVLIDCGYKPGSPGKMEQPTRVKEIAQDIMATTGGVIDVAIVTHEHQDHVNGLTSANFPDLQVGKTCFAWTENGNDEVANQLRKKFKDRLLSLIDTRANLVGMGKSDEADRIKSFLERELGEEPDDFNGIATRPANGKDPSKSGNKIAMQFLRECSQEDPEYLYPHEKALEIPGAKSARAFVLGPPRDIDKIDDLNPRGEETFEDHEHAMGGTQGGGAQPASKASPFQNRHVIPLDQAFTDPKWGSYFRQNYGADSMAVVEASDGNEIPSNAQWRRLTADDAAEAEALALAMNNATNNSSLVLAFELSKGGKVLLFVGDAQAGNWRSWADNDFDDEGEAISVADLLARTVVYKVGHHGSHNATLKGAAGTDKPSLSAMAKGDHAKEFVAMITAVEAWARQKPRPDWNHPLPAIKDALVKKAGGRVLQTDSELPDKPSRLGAANWNDFASRVTATPLYFDLIVEP